MNKSYLPNDEDHTVYADMGQSHEIRTFKKGLNRIESV